MDNTPHTLNPNSNVPGVPVRTRRAQVAGLIASLLVCAIASGIGGYVTAGSVGTWYRTLEKPFFNPPDWVFAPVWTTLFVMMAVAAWRVWRAQAWPLIRTALVLYAIQLALNVAWSALFFGARSPGAALIVTARVFARFDRIAAWMMAPYAAWVAFATLLNAAIWRLN